MRVRISVVIDCQDTQGLVPFWEAALEYTRQHDMGHFQVLLPKDLKSRGPVLLLQEVPEGKAGKNRTHLDIHPDDPASHIELLESLGGQQVGVRVEEFGVWWQVMADPEGNEFCIVADAEPPPTE